MAQTISGRLIDLHQRRIYPAEISFEKGSITAIKEIASARDYYMLPGFIDAHVHIESSMLLPSAFARLAVKHGTIGTVSDPHEIANVCGVQGVDYMTDNAAQTPFKVFFGAPSCVPATGFETAGAVLDAAAVRELLQRKDIWYLTEMMNFPGVLHSDKEVMEKIAAAKAVNKPVDGHAPGLRNSEAAQYAAAGIITDHECVSLEEALDKIAAGMHIIIREGSAAKNFDALHPLLSLHPEKTMLCSDDKHPDDLLLHHINKLVQRALAKGHDLFDVLRAACINPIAHYGIPVGQLRAGDPADFIIIDNLTDWQIKSTYINGECVWDGKETMLPEVTALPINHFLKEEKVSPLSLALPAAAGQINVRIIQVHEGQLITSADEAVLLTEGGKVIANTTQDVLKLVVINRYETASAPAIAFIKGFGLKHGALASTIAHDCHNIIAVGVDDTSICTAVNAIIEHKGGIAVAHYTEIKALLPLPVAGLMSLAAGEKVAKEYAQLNKAAFDLGSSLHAPFMTLSFMALLVIPELKLSDKGLFDGKRFDFVSLFK